MECQDEWKADEYPCPKCKGIIHWMIWESSDGGHEDVHYHCRSCGYDRWVDGCDS